jgi:hypothetical protein
LDTTTELHISILYHTVEMRKLGAEDTHNNVEINMHPSWSPPMEHTYKINCDEAFMKETQNGGWGYVLMDHHIEFLAGSAGHLRAYVKCTTGRGICMFEGG